MKENINLTGLSNAEKVTLKNLFQDLSPEAYKEALGMLLSFGQRRNLFEYPNNIFPPPTPARVYIKDFLLKHKDKIKGRVIEFAPPIYKPLLNSEEVTDYDVWNVKPGKNISIVGDLLDPTVLPKESVDTVLLTHVLSAVGEPLTAINNIRSFLRKDGIILCTVPVVLQKFAPDPKDFWRFTEDSLKFLFSSMTIKEYQAYGNAATVSGSSQFLMSQHFDKKILFQNDKECPSILAAVIQK